MNPAFLHALIREREADVLRELRLAAALRQTRGGRRRLRRAAELRVVQVRPKLSPIAGDGRGSAVEAGTACLADSVPNPAA